MVSGAYEAEFDVIVIGGGHAGTEAAVAAARAGSRVALITASLEQIGQLSCNPAIGGVAKGTVVREVDALGGLIARATDLAAVQFRMLNRGKGPAVWAPRAQCDRGLYRRAVRQLLEAQPRLVTVQGMVARLLFDGPAQSEAPHLSGLIDVAMIATTTVSSRGSDPHLAGSTRGRSGPNAVGSRPAEVLSKPINLAASEETAAKEIRTHLLKGNGREASYVVTAP